MRFTQSEWLLILAAFAYEEMDESVMSDWGYDKLSKNLKTTNIPEFDVSTGIWIHKLVDEIGRDKLEYWVRKLLVNGQGTSICWIIPKDMIIDYNNSYENEWTPKEPKCA
jgi:hypothetical protein